jgi:chromosome partitioning protein
MRPGAGAGQSTLALHLACEAVTRGKKMLLLDLDPQGSLASWGAKRWRAEQREKML